MMKKKAFLAILITVLILAILFVPVPKSPYRDGGTREYCALAYRVVDWNRLTTDGVYDATKVYWFPDNFNAIDDLWACEEQNVVHKFVATVLELDTVTALVQPVEGEEELRSCSKIYIGLADLDDIGAEVGSDVEIYYTGGIMESSPAQVRAVKWELANNLRHKEYTEQWLDKETAEKYDNLVFDHIIITRIYKNCFFARTVIPMPYEIKLNGSLSKDWCVGDQVSCTHENTYYDDKNERIECDMLSIEASDWEPDPNAAYKPVIYLYPKKETGISVKLFLDGRLTCTYPHYSGAWRVTAETDGTLINHEDGRE